MSQKQQPYWQRKQESYANVDVGNKIECANCCQMRFLARYSQNQIKKYQESIYRARRGGPAAELPRCRECTAGNTVELKCTGCYVTKGIDYFAKQQRKNPDNAKCIPCQQDIIDIEPNLQDANDEERIREETQNRRANPFPGMSTVASAGGSNAGSGYRSQATDAASGGVMIVQDQGSAWGGSSVVRPSPPTSSTVSGYHLQSTLDYSNYSTPPTGSMHSTGTTRGGFHKQGAYKPPVHERVKNSLQREELRGQEAQATSTRDDDDDDDGEEWEM